MEASIMRIFVLAGMVFCLLYLIYILLKHHRLIMQCRNETAGKVVGFQVTAYGDDAAALRLFVSFDTDSGKIQGLDAWYSKAGAFSNGDRVTVFYDPDNPKKFYVAENNYPESLIKVSLILIVLVFPSFIALTYIFV